MNGFPPIMLILLGNQFLLFELHRQHPAEVYVSVRSVAEHLEVVQDVGPSFRNRSVDLPPDAFPVEARKNDSIAALPNALPRRLMLPRMLCSSQNRSQSSFAY